MKVSEVIVRKLTRLDARFGVARASGDDRACERIKRRCVRAWGIYRRARDFEEMQPL